MNKLLILPILLTLLASCNKYKVEGTASASRTDLDGRMLYLKYLDESQQWQYLDSCEIVHGKFEMSGNIDTVIMATLFMDTHGILPLVIEEGHIKVMIDDWNLKASGTDLNDKLYAFLDEKNAIEQKASELSHKHSLMIMNGTPMQEAEDMLNKEGQVLSKDLNRLVIDFVTDNFDNVLSYEVFMMVVSSMSCPVMTPEIKEILDKAPESFKERAYVKEFLSQARQ